MTTQEIMTAIRAEIENVPADILERNDIRVSQTKAIHEDSADYVLMIETAFQYGFAKGWKARQK